MGWRSRDPEDGMPRDRQAMRTRAGWWAGELLGALMLCLIAVHPGAAAPPGQATLVGPSDILADLHLEIGERGHPLLSQSERRDECHARPGVHGRAGEMRERGDPLLHSPDGDTGGGPRGVVGPGVELGRSGAIEQGHDLPSVFFTPYVAPHPG